MKRNYLAYTVAIFLIAPVVIITGTTVQHILIKKRVQANFARECLDAARAPGPVSFCPARATASVQWSRCCIYGPYTSANAVAASQLTTSAPQDAIDYINEHDNRLLVMFTQGENTVMWFGIGRSELPIAIKSLPLCFSNNGTCAVLTRNSDNELVAHE